MAKITLKGNACNTSGELPAAGSTAPDFLLVDSTLANKRLADFGGKRKLLSILPSLDTPVCQMSTKKFNEQAGAVENAVVLVVSADLPFAMKRFCEAEGLKGVHPLSTFRDPEFGKKYGIQITDGALAGLTGRAIVVLDENNKVVHRELVGEIANEPNYAAALAALRG